MIDPRLALRLLISTWAIVIALLFGLGWFQSRQRAQATLPEDPGQFCVRIALGYDLIRCYDVDTGNFCYLRGEAGIACVTGPFVERVPLLR